MRCLVAFAMLFALVGGIASTDAGGCAGSSAWGGNCNVENDGSSVEIGATQDGSNPSEGARDDDDVDRESGPRDATTGPSPSATPCNPLDLVCVRAGSGYTVAVIQQPTLADVARFAPASVPLVDEPDGVGVVGMPMNFVVDAQTHERTGTLFDLPVTVRFTPASVLFVHGDGTSRVSDGGGRSWAALGLAQFSATPTSHAYTARGSYTASAVVRYAAQVNFGNGWVAVPGVLEIPTTSGDVQIFEVRTALVDKTCLENPGGVGC